MKKKDIKGDYGNGIMVVWSPVNSAYFTLWGKGPAASRQVLKVAGYDATIDFINQIFSKDSETKPANVGLFKKNPFISDDDILKQGRALAKEAGNRDYMHTVLPHVEVITWRDGKKFQTIAQETRGAHNTLGATQSDKLHGGNGAEEAHVMFVRDFSPGGYRQGQISDNPLTPAETRELLTWRKSTLKRSKDKDYNARTRFGYAKKAEALGAVAHYYAEPRLKRIVTHALAKNPLTAREAAEIKRVAGEHYKDSREHKSKALQLFDAGTSAGLTEAMAIAGANKNPYYAGHKRGTYNYEVFSSKTRPTQESHGGKYAYVTGPKPTREKLIAHMRQWNQTRPTGGRLENPAPRKIHFYLDGEYVFTSTRYRTLKEGLAAQAGLTGVMVAGRELTGKPPMVMLEGKRLTAQFATRDNPLTRREQAYLFKEARHDVRLAKYTGDIKMKHHFIGQAEGKIFAAHVFGGGGKKFKQGMNIASRMHEKINRMDFLKNPGEFKSAREFRDYLEYTLIPELKELTDNNSVFLHSVFSRLLTALKLRKFKADFVGYLKQDVIPQLHKSGLGYRARDLEAGVKFLYAESKR